VTAEDAFGEIETRGGPLVRCPSCASRLIYPTDIAGLGGRVVLTRRCPECEHHDSVVAGAMAAAAWYRRELQHKARLEAHVAAATARGREGSADERAA
jgi:hypothetical protein